MSSRALPVPSNPVTLKPDYDVVIVGSGLGAAIMAARCAAAGKATAIFEPQQTIGKEPAQTAWPFAHEPELFINPALPQEIRNDAAGLRDALARAERFAAAGSAQDEEALTATYLGDAAARGCSIFVGFAPQDLASHALGFKLGFQIEGVGRERYDAPALFITAAVVVVGNGVAAGAWLKQTGLPSSGQAGATCSMSDNGQQGATDAQGRFWKGAGTDVYENLLAAGRTLCSSSLGACPTLSLAALTERQAALLAQASGHAQAPLDPLPCPPPPVAPGLRFTEAMTGFVSDQVKAAGAFEAGFQCGKRDACALVFVLTLATDNVDAMGRDPQHPARSVGTVVAPALDPRPLLVAGGDFNLFVDQADGSRRMKYRMQLVAEGGRTFFFDGFKVIRDDPGVDIWADTTTLYVTVYDGATDQSPVWGRGILHILPKDFASQLLTFQATNARNKWQQIRAQTGFYRLFMGTLWTSYVGMSSFLPDVRKPGGVFKLLPAKLAWLGVIVLAALFWIWPWRPAILRNHPHIAPRSALAAAQVPGDVEKLALFPQLLDGLQIDPSSTKVEQQTYHCSWVPDNLVQTHGALGEVPFHPSDISVLSDLAIKKSFINLTRIRNGAGQVIGMGSQVEIIILNKGAVTRTSIDAFTDWSLTFPGRGMLFLGQVEGGPELASLHSAAAKSGQPWRGLLEINHTLGPLPEGRGIVHAGTGAFRDVIGAFREFNILKEVPEHGDMVADSRYELSLLHAAANESAGPPEAQELGLPSRCTRRLKRQLGWRIVKRKFTIDLPRDTVYSTGGSKAATNPFPSSLGYLTDPALSELRVFLGKLRDEHGEVTGLAGASSAPGPDGKQLAQWTLTISGAGTLYVAADEADSAANGRPGYLARRRGLIVGGTGAFANATGVLRERWPDTANGAVAFDVSLVTN